MSYCSNCPIHSRDPHLRADLCRCDLDAGSEECVDVLLEKYDDFLSLKARYEELRKMLNRIASETENEEISTETLRTRIQRILLQNPAFQAEESLLEGREKAILYEECDAQVYDYLLENVPEEYKNYADEFEMQVPFKSGNFAYLEFSGTKDLLVRFLRKGTNPENTSKKDILMEEASSYDSSFQCAALIVGNYMRICGEEISL